MSQEEDWDAWEPSNSVQLPSQKHYNRPIHKQLNINPDDILVDIDARLAGMVIGKGGAKIKSLRKESGAFISVIDSDCYGVKTVKISGDSKAKELAQKLINDLIEENDPEKIRKKLQEATSSEPAPSLSNLDWDQLLKEQAENLKKKLDALPPIIKNFYKEHPEVSMMSDQEVEDFRLSKNNIMVKYLDENNEKPIPKPILQFSHAFEDYPEILREIQKQKFETPSPVQCQAWPIIMSGHDLIAIAQTGTGKTLAFLLPAFIHLDFQSTPRDQRKGPSILVLAPTRELVLQIESEVCVLYFFMFTVDNSVSNLYRKCFKSVLKLLKIYLIN